MRVVNKVSKFQIKALGIYNHSFLIERPFEQIKLDIDQQMANVNLVGLEYPSLDPRMLT